MTDEIEFIKKELKEKGYPLENYVQLLLMNQDWHVQPNAYFLDKDTNKGRELDIKATYDDFESNSWSHLVLNLLIQCRRLPGNAWIFFSIPGRPDISMPISRLSLAEISLEPGGLHALAREIFEQKGTHFNKSEVLATNYCEIITDKEKSNKKDNNIWECVITLIKATSQELDQTYADVKQYLEGDLGSFNEFVKEPFEVIYIFYPLIVFEGKMYEAKFYDDDITLEKRKYVQLFVDYQSGRYKGKFCIDVITKERFSDYLEDIRKDLIVFDKRRVEKSKDYQENAFKAVKRHLAKKYDIY